MLRLPRDVYLQMVAHCFDGLPLEACGLLAGPPPAGEQTAQTAQTAQNAQTATVCYPTANAAASARVYTVEPRDFLRADRDAESRGLEIVSVFHSHTHTDAYPSPTDIGQAPDPGWHYVLVSLRDVVPVVRSYLIVDGKVTEEPVVLE
ncbi:MAG: [CysO sulfur-carrier protein]-S-L-cysteine hydrolase [Acidimicrobiaceae bacterium]|nr:[CysO sulfur-carrier protein]-S-L-cysteine hydrolase [Acidimicrobiaceae bacterium]